LDLARLFTALGLIADYSVLQKASRVRGHARRWPPGALPPSTAAVQGYPGMALRLHLGYNQAAPLLGSGGGAGLALEALEVPGPVPSSVAAYSKPSVQRHVSAAALLSLRAHKPPGLFLLSTKAGLLTDIEAELLGEGGVLLGYCGLPLVKVLQLRGLLKGRLEAQQAAAAAAGVPPGAFRYKGLSEWDPVAEVGPLLEARLDPGQYRGAADALIDGAIQQAAQVEALVGKATSLAREATLQRSVWAHREELQAAARKAQQDRGSAAPAQWRGRSVSRGRRGGSEQ
jgi:ribosomal protein S8